MSLDGAFLHIVKTELIDSGLVGGRIDKIHQPSKDEIIIALRTSGGIKKLVFSANPAQARVHLTDNTPENPKSPPMFCMLLRKHLGGGRLSEIKQDGFERIIDFCFECMNEMGDMVTNRLVIEIMGRASNIILLGHKNGALRVIDSLKRVTDEISSVRRVLPGVVYELPPKPHRLSLLEFSEEEFCKSFSEHSNIKAVKALPMIFEGIAPIFARECVHYAAGDLDITAGGLDKSAHERLLFFLKRARGVLMDGGKPVIVSERSGKPIDFCFINIHQYGSAAAITEFSGEHPANALLEAFFGSRADAERAKQRSGHILKLVMTAYERVSRKTDAQREELERCKERDSLRLYGDLISSNIHNMHKGMNVLITENYLTGEQVSIKLDRRLTPVQNAQKYYADYKKLDTAEKMLIKLIAGGEKELVYLDSVFDAASRARTEAEFSEIRAELAETGYLKKTRGKEKEPKPTPPLHFISGDRDIYVGRNNKQNDNLTFKKAAGSDIWLHVKNIAGSHVILKDNGTPVTDDVLTEAAIIAAYCSKARGGSRVPVDYTLARYVKKPAGAKPGMVIFTNNKTLFVTPDEEIYNKLLKK